MYDPHRLRRNDRRYFTRKGQIIQAKAMSVPFKIESNKVDAYKNYLLQNQMIYLSDIPGALRLPIPITSIRIEDDATNVRVIPLEDFTFYPEVTTIQLNQSTGIRILFNVTHEKGYYNFNIELTEDVTATTKAPNTWFSYALFPANDIYKIFFRNGSNAFFNTELIRGADGIEETDVELFESNLLPQLPAPSES